MKERGSIVYDFDGTWTDSYEEIRLALTSLLNYLRLQLSIAPAEFLRVFESQLSVVMNDHESYGIRKDPNSRIITAPLSSSIFELYAHAIAGTLNYFVNNSEIGEDAKQPVPAQFLRILSSQVLPCRGCSVDTLALSRILLHSFLNQIPAVNATVFRPGLEDNIRFALARGFDVAVVSNSPKEVIMRKIKTRQSLLALVQRIGDDRVIGSAGKDRIYPDWDGQVEVSRCSRVNGVPERIRITKYGLNRPIYMRRQSFADHLERLGFTIAFPRFAIGDCAENDLLLPHMLHAEVGLINHAHLPLHERRWAEGEGGARLIRSFEDIGEMLSAAA